jgi:hypothetical protein
MHEHVATSERSMTPSRTTRGPDPADVAQARLRGSAYAELRALACDSHEGVLAIRGQVSSFYLKQLAQTAIRDVPGVEMIHNQVRVLGPEGKPC